MRWVALDFETSDTNAFTCEFAGVGIQWFDPEGRDEEPSTYIPKEQGWEACLGNVVFGLPIVMHNASFDLTLLHRLGIRPETDIHDTMLMAKHIHNNWPCYDLKSLAWYHFSDTYQPLLNLRNWFREQRVHVDDEQDMDYTKAPVELVAPYCKHDIEMTVALTRLFWPKLKDHYAYNLDAECIRYDNDMKERGLVANLKFYQDTARLGKRRMRYNLDRAREHMGVEGNPKGNALQEHMKKLGESRLTKTKRIATGDVVLRDWKGKDKGIGSIMRVKADEKNVNTYALNVLAVATPMEKHPELGVFHAQHQQSAAVTRRYKCRGLHGRNGVVAKGQVQNFPPIMREGIVCPPGYEFWKEDMASIEARMFSGMMSLLIGEDHFAKLYRDDPWFNVYLHVLSECAGVHGATKKHELYTPYKHGTLGRLYGSSAKRFSIQLRDDFGIDYSIDRCSEIYATIDRKFPFIRKFQGMLTALAMKQGYVVDPFGAIYYVPKDETYKVVAYINQGAAGMVLKWWWHEVWNLMIANREKGFDDYIFNTVHDEFDFAIQKKGNTKKRAQSYGDVLEKLDLFNLPLRAEVIGPVSNWREAG